MGNISSYKMSTCPLALKTGRSESESKLGVSVLHLIIPGLPSGVEEGATGGAGDSRMEDQQEGAGQEHVHELHSPLQMGLLLANIVPHLNAHVFPVRVETYHCRLLLFLGREHVQTACYSLATPHQPLDDTFPLAPYLSP